jgi:hypothetical protein
VYPIYCVLARTVVFDAMMEELATQSEYNAANAVSHFKEQACMTFMG